MSHIVQTRSWVGAMMLMLGILACSSSLQVPTPTAAPTFTVTIAPTSTPIPAATATLIDTGRIPPWPVLERGDSGLPETFALQRLLRQHGFVVYADGRFGEQTFTAVKGAQAALGVPADGRVDEDTWVALVHDLELGAGDRGEAVVAALYLLHFKFGYRLGTEGPIGSYFGSDQVAALRDFKARFRLSPNDILDLPTWQALVSIRLSNEPSMSNPP